VNYSNKQIGNMRATAMVPTHGGGVGVYYHDTLVVEKLNDGRFVLDSGGFRTKTTKTRINQFTPPGCNLYQEGGPDHWFIKDRQGNPVEFSDGMILDSDGFPTGETCEQ
jgi:hypothetical protein